MPTPIRTGPPLRSLLVGAILALVAFQGVALVWLGSGEDGLGASPSTTSGAPPTSSTSTTATTTPAPCSPPVAEEADSAARFLYAAYSRDDRSCADSLGTAEAVEALFAIAGSGDGWTLVGCTPAVRPDRAVCTFSVDEGGTTSFRMQRGEDGEWIAGGVSTQPG